MSSFKEFQDDLRYALNHLYEPEILQYSPLKQLLLSPEEADFQGALSKLLVNAIEVLKPKPPTPPDSPMWRVYELLYYRYVQCAHQADLAKQFSCSIRQIRREQSKALAILAEYLLRQAGLSEKDLSKLMKRPESDHPLEKNSILRQEVESILRNCQGESTEISTELIALSDVLQPLLRQYRVNLNLSTENKPSLAAIPGVALRQALLSILSGVVRYASGGNIKVQCQQKSGDVCVNIQAFCSPGKKELKWDEGIHEARSLLLMCGAKLLFYQEGPRLTINVELPSVNPVIVLAIDDNRDMLQLLQQYTSGTRYQLIPCNDSKKVLSLVETEHPMIITLDIMMSGVDGWQLLEELHSNPSSVHIPIIVCSVLTQEELAKSLGVQGYIRKPVSREAYLRALDCQMSSKG